MHSSKVAFSNDTRRYQARSQAQAVAVRVPVGVVTEALHLMA